MSHRVLRAAIEVYRRGWVPRRLVAAVAPRWTMSWGVKIDASQAAS